MTDDAVVFVAGARPNFMKVAPMLRAMREGAAPFRRVLVHTGQHYDDAMSEVFFREFERPAPDVHLNVGSGSHGAQTAKVLAAFEDYLLGARPRGVVVVGDVNSTMACTLAAVKLGVVLVPVNVLYRERELRHILSDAEPVAVVTSRDMATYLPAGVPVWDVDLLATEAATQASDRQAVGGAADTPLALIYTSGTTGASKGAVLTHGNFAANGQSLVNAWRITEADRYLATLPLFHVHGLANGVHCWLFSGCHMRLTERLESWQAAAEVITDTAFLIQDLKVEPGSGAPSSCGLVHRNPPCSNWTFASQVMRGMLIWNYGKPEHLLRPVPKVKGVLPALQWEAFPSQAPREPRVNPEFPNITDIRYDLRIWSSAGGGPGDLVYERLNLNLEARTEPLSAPEDAKEGVPTAAPVSFVEHRLDEPLAPNTEYLWSVRARYRLNGELRATRWSILAFSSPGRPDPCHYDGIPPDRYHRFRTP